ncbi:hypothetical protein [Streptomyces sp. NPDC052701]
MRAWPLHALRQIFTCTLDRNGLVGAAELAWQPVLDGPLGALR